MLRMCLAIGLLSGCVASLSAAEGTVAAIKTAPGWGLREDRQRAPQVG
jgi:hypothetical protein